MKGIGVKCVIKREESLKTAKPILFNTEMVRAIQDDRKTVTRRVIKNLPDGVHTFFPPEKGSDKFEFLCGKNVNGMCVDFGVEIAPPYKVGDYLYVRETWAKISDWIDVDPEVGIFDGYIYKANWADNKEHPTWKPSIHMPKEAARIFLRVTSVRVERLQDITNEQAIREGIEPHEFLTNSAGTYVEYCIPGMYTICPEAWGAFTHLWNSTIKKKDLDKYGWGANPWVWVIEFERVEVTDNA